MRELVPPDEVDHVVDCHPEHCRRCGKKLLAADDPSPIQHQVFELPRITPEVTEYRLHGVKCSCGITTRANLPVGVPSGVLGSRFSAFVTMLTGVYHMSRRQTVSLIHDLTGVRLSIGTVSQSEHRMSEALAAPVADAHEAIRKEPVKHIDETGWVQSAERRSLWTIATTTLTVFVIAADATRVTVQQLLGTIQGVLISDRAAVFQFWAVKNRQVCWAHLIRKFVSFTEYNEPRAQELGAHLLLLSQSLLHCWHQVRDGTRTRAQLQNITDQLRKRFLIHLRRGVELQLPEVSGSCSNLLEHEPALWTFVYTLNVEPTNNHAEQQLRSFVQWRKKCFGTQSERGSRFAERMMTVAHSLRKQHRDILSFITDAYQAALNKESAPSLLPKCV
jgi:transposase